MKYNIYGRKIEIIRDAGKWNVFILGTDGKKRITNDIFISSDIGEDQLRIYLEDLLHEYARPGSSGIKRI